MNSFNLPRQYYQLMKPGIIRGNIIVLTAGYLFAAQGHINWVTLFATIFGTSLIIGSSCVANNVIDKDIDSMMKRTKKRSLVTGEISSTSACIFSAILFVLGLGILFYYSSVQTAILGLSGWILYVYFYTLVSKRNTVHGTLIGSLSGAIPPVAGYAAFNGTLDMAALLLFLCLVTWQMPHFYAIAVYREDEYKSANIPVLPVVKGLTKTRIEIISYATLFLLTNIALYSWVLISTITAIVLLLLSLWWLRYTIHPLSKNNQVKWGKQVFGGSLVVLLSWSVLLSIDFLFA